MNICNKAIPRILDTQTNISVAKCLVFETLNKAWNAILDSLQKVFKGYSDTIQIDQRSAFMNERFKRPVQNLRTELRLSEFIVTYQFRVTNYHEP